MRRTLMVGMAATWALAVWLGPVSGVAQEPHGPVAPAGVPPDDLFQTSSDCLACHNGLTTPAGEDVSIGVQWRASMMANSSRDPYWHAAAIEDECSICHMPMARTRAGALGLEGRVFANLPRSGGGDTLEAQLAADGVSCTVCHQISDERLGTPESFGGGFVMAAPAADGSRSIAGPLRGQRRPHRADAVGDGRAADRGGPRSPVGVVRDVPHADDRSV